ncbi:beta-barrel fold lipoprotein [Pontibacter toksunensis]|uniref:Beta-barrel fold lipoprotein n=1 Tax=Pontibacter toksunensis TaxID=1332631 RepID=A0ABW6C056_9BACT
MKTLSRLTVLLFSVLLLAGCGDSGKDTPTPDAATFRVDIAQSGDYEKFGRIISIKGGEFYRTGTQEQMPVVLFEEHLTEETYSYEAEGVRELNIQTTYGFSSVETPPAAMELKITVYKNGKQIDHRTYGYTEEDSEVNEFLTYKANQ